MNQELVVSDRFRCTKKLQIAYSAGLWQSRVHTFANK